MNAHRAQAIVGDGGSVTLRGLPLRIGEEVEVIVLTRDEVRPRRSADEVRKRLRGSVLKDERPFDPAVPPEEWDAVR